MIASSASVIKHKIAPFDDKSTPGSSQGARRQLALSNDVQALRRELGLSAAHRPDETSGNGEGRGDLLRVLRRDLADFTKLGQRFQKVADKRFAKSRTTD
ncbi:hypothetical protein ACC786_20110, partial [Rhizobium ruizarguesonis]